MINDEVAEAIASVRYRDDNFKRLRLYTSWDNARDEKRLFAGLETLVRHGIKPHNLLIYFLVGYWHGPKLVQEDFYRHRRLREYGTLPFPMPYVRTKELVGFQRWIVGFYDKKVSWEEFTKARWQPENLPPKR